MAAEDTKGVEPAITAGSCLNKTIAKISFPKRRPGKVSVVSCKRPFPFEILPPPAIKNLRKFLVRTEILKTLSFRVSVSNTMRRRFLLTKVAGSVNVAKMISRIHRAQGKIRTELKNPAQWMKYGYYKNVDVSYATAAHYDKVPRVDGRNLTHEQFCEIHESLGGGPIVLTGLTEQWPAAVRWSPNKLCQRFGMERFRVGDNDRGHAVRLRLATYLWYAQHIAPYEDNPLYLFDGDIDESIACRKMLSEYAVPKCFQADMFAGIKESKRPPYRWLMVGAQRSGSAIHYDPLGTTAWNTTIRGHKRWVLFEPGAPENVVRPPKFRDLWPAHIGGAAAWFDLVYPHTRGPHWNKFKPVEILQRPGETVYIPTGWWHVVLNLDPIVVAVTQNLAERRNLRRVRRKVKRRRSDIYEQFKKYNNLAESNGEEEYESGFDSSSSSSSGSTSSSTTDSDDE